LTKLKKKMIRLKINNKIKKINNLKMIAILKKMTNNSYKKQINIDKKMKK